MTRTTLLTYLLSVTLAVLLQSMPAAAQSAFRAAGPGGPVGENLFPESGLLETSLETPLLTSEMISALSDWHEELDQRYPDGRMKANDFTVRDSTVSFDVQLYLGKADDDISLMHHSWKYSEVKFDVMVQVSDGHFSIVFSNFETDRVTLHGEAKSFGPSNIIHWQRNNALRQERALLLTKRKLSRKDMQLLSEYDYLLDREQAMYETEWEETDALFMELVSVCLPAARQ